MSSVGMMRAAMASISVACSGEKNSNLGGVADWAARRAWSAAARTAGHWAAIQALERPVMPWARNRRRESELSMRARLRAVGKLYDDGQTGSRRKGCWERNKAREFAVLRGASVGFRRNTAAERCLVD